MHLIQRYDIYYHMGLNNELFPYITVYEQNTFTRISWKHDSKEPNI